MPSTELFNLDLVEAYEEADADEGPARSLSPAVSDRPPRTSSLAQTVSSRSLSVDHDFNGPRQPVRRPQKGGWMDRPHPLRAKTSKPIAKLSPPLEVQSAQLPQPLPFLDEDPNRTAFEKKHRRRMTISESRKSARNTVIVAQPSGLTEQDIPPMPDPPALSPSNSTATSVPSLTPTTPLSYMALAPTEDQIRRELEMMTLRDGADPLTSHRYGGRASSDLLSELISEVEVKPLSIPRPSTARARTPTKSDEHAFQDDIDRPQLRRRKSIVEYFRKSPVDKLLDLYLDESPPSTKKEPPDKKASDKKPPEKKSSEKEASFKTAEMEAVTTTTTSSGHKRRPSLVRRMTINLKSSKDKMPNVPPIPSQFSPSQSRFDFD